MKAHKLPLGQSISVETTTDAHRIINSPYQLTMYIMDFGDVDVEYDENARVYRVPAFAEKIAEYSKKKAVDCVRWGCE